MSFLFSDYEFLFLERTDEQLKRISSEIQVMKANRVKLVRQMREENEKYRVWRQQKEREVARLKDQDRKRQGQLQRMETLHTKQQNVLRRKMEDAMAVSKRLKEALSLNSQKLSNKAAANSSENEKRIKGKLTPRRVLDKRFNSLQAFEKNLKQFHQDCTIFLTRKIGCLSQVFVVKLNAAINPWLDLIKYCELGQQQDGLWAN